MAVLFLSAQGVYAQCTRNSLPKVPFDSVKLAAHVKILASDEFEGRGPASAGEKKTIDYISRQFAALGLQPGGESKGWLQPVALRKIEIVKPAALRIAAGASRYEIAHGEESVFTSFTGQTDIEIKDAPLIFVGYGVTAPEVGWDDFKGADLKGKVAVFLINDPDFEASVPGKFGGKAMTYYGRWSYKFEEAARRGARGALIVHEDAPAAYGWATVKNSWGGSQFDIVRTDAEKSQVPMRGWLRRDVAVKLFDQAGLDFDELRKRAARPDFTPVKLDGASVSVRAHLTVTEVLSHNVIGKLPGRERANESVIYGAHWDHLGIGKPDISGDRIYNGAADNATGVAALVELARVFAAAPRTARSIYFVAFTAEEQGLLGAEYYTLHPPSALEKTAAILNLDLFGTAGAACDLAIRGTVNSSLHGSIAAAARAQGRTVTPDSHLDAGYFYRADHFPFAKKGVPAITLMSGQDLYEGGSVAGEKAYNDYIEHRYHQPGDRWSSDWDLRGEALDLDVVYRVGRDIANSTQWPEWNAGTEFKLVRDGSAGTRTQK